jgi:hypothetical protein
MRPLGKGCHMKKFGHPHKPVLLNFISAKQTTLPRT